MTSKKLLPIEVIQKTLLKHPDAFKAMSNQDIKLLRDTFGKDIKSIQQLSE